MNECNRQKRGEDVRVRGKIVHVDESAGDTHAARMRAEEKEKA